MIILTESAPVGHYKFLSLISKFLLKRMGWKIIPRTFRLPKAILVAGPHTSNWDFVIGMLFMMAINIDLKWMGKSTIFKWPFKGILKGMGGVPIDRTKRINAVDQSVEIFNSKEKMILALSPEGTRSKTNKWKSGFYHIAKNANVPIVIVSIDYRKKSLSFEEPLNVSGSFDDTVEAIRSYWNKCQPKHIDQF